MDPTRKLHLDTTRMIQKYPDSPWKNHSLTPAKPNMWVAGSYGYSIDWMPIFYDQDYRVIRTVGELITTDIVDRALGYKVTGMFRYLIIGPSKK